LVVCSDGKRKFDSLRNFVWSTKSQPKKRSVAQFCFETTPGNRKEINIAFIVPLVTCCEVDSIAGQDFQSLDVKGKPFMGYNKIIILHQP
jgi:hypothetical protein